MKIEVLHTMGALKHLAKIAKKRKLDWIITAEAFAQLCTDLEESQNGEIEIQKPNYKPQYFSVDELKCEHIKVVNFEVECCEYQRDLGFETEWEFGKGFEFKQDADAYAERIGGEYTNTRVVKV